MIKRIIAWAIFCSCFFLTQSVDAQTEETPITSIEESIELTEEPQVYLSIEELLDAIVVAEKKLESVQKELRYTETLKGNKKYKKEVVQKFELANNNLKLAQAAYEAATISNEPEILEEETELIDEASTETLP